MGCCRGHFFFDFYSKSVSIPRLFFFSVFAEDGRTDGGLIPRLAFFLLTSFVLLCTVHIAVPFFSDDGPVQSIMPGDIAASQRIRTARNGLSCSKKRGKPGTMPFRRTDEGGSKCFRPRRRGRGLTLLVIPASSSGTRPGGFHFTCGCNVSIYGTYGATAGSSGW